MAHQGYPSPDSAVVTVATYKNSMLDLSRSECSCCRLLFFCTTLSALSLPVRVSRKRSDVHVTDGAITVLGAVTGNGLTMLCKLVLQISRKRLAENVCIVVFMGYFRDDKSSCSAPDLFELREQVRLALGSSTTLMVTGTAYGSG